MQAHGLSTVFTTQREITIMPQFNINTLLFVFVPSSVTTRERPCLPHVPTNLGKPKGYRSVPSEYLFSMFFTLIRSWLMGGMVHSVTVLVTYRMLAQGMITECISPGSPSSATR